MREQVSIQYASAQRLVLEAHNDDEGCRDDKPPDGPVLQARGQPTPAQVGAQEEGNTMFNHSYIVLSHSFQSSTPTVLYNTCTGGDVTYTYVRKSTVSRQYSKLLRTDVLAVVP